MDPEKPRNTRPLILVVDADPNIRDLAGYFLAEAGYNVEFAFDGYEALDRSRKLPPTLILVDIVLPRLSGLALCRLLKSDPSTQKIKIVIFSEIGSLETAQQSGADAFLSKPLEKSSLEDLVSKVINSKEHST